jgi:hypothetical protein
VPKKIKHTFFQNGFNGCVGASTSMLMSTLNTLPGHVAIPYSFFFVWETAKANDEWNDTNPGDNNGTSVRAGLDVIRKYGMVTRKSRTPETAMPKNPQPNPDDGILSNWWATDINQMRAVLASGLCVVVGTAWNNDMSNPVQQKDGTYRMPAGITIDRNTEGHAWMIRGANDDRECFYMPNTWDDDWPGNGQFDCEVPYTLMTQLLASEGECGVVVDKVRGKALGLTPDDPMSLK